MLGMDASDPFFGASFCASADNNLLVDITDGNGKLWFPKVPIVGILLKVLGATVGAYIEGILW